MNKKYYKDKIIHYIKETGQYCFIDVDGRILDMLTLEQVQEYEDFKRSETVLKEQQQQFTELLFG